MPLPAAEPLPRALSRSAAPPAPAHAVPALLGAAAALSTALAAASVPHAFGGGVLPALLARAPAADEIVCVVDGGPTHPFRAVVAALASAPALVPVPSPCRGHLVVRVGAIDIAILAAGEDGPRRLDADTVAPEAGLPFLRATEFVRTKLRAWMLRRRPRDAADAAAIFVRCWATLDLNRLPTDDVRELARAHPEIGPVWAALRRRYRT